MMGYYLLDYNPGTQQWGFPRRGGHKPSGTVIIHTAECARDDVGEDTSAEGCAHMIANRADYGSYHRLVDSDSIIRMLPWEYEAWQDSETNNWAVGISAALRTIDWLPMPADRREKVYRNLALCAAEFVTHMKTKYGIEVPLKRISGADARRGVPGFCAHGDSGVARSDPGANFDWTKFFSYVGELTKKEMFTVSQYEELMNAIKNTHAGIWYGGTGGGKTYKYGVLPIVVHNQTLISKMQAQLGGLVGAINALSKGEQFDEAKLLAGIEEAAERGTLKALESGVVDVNVTVRGGDSGSA